MKKILVCGARDWTDGQLIRSKLMEYALPLTPEQVTVYERGLVGAEAQAGRIASHMGMTVKTLSVDWKIHGKHASDMRDQESLKLKPDVVLGFVMENSTSAWTLLRLAQAEGIPTRAFTENGVELGTSLGPPSHDDFEDEAGSLIAKISPLKGW